MSARTCTGCDAGMNEGWFCCDEYFCSEPCLNKSFEGSGETWDEHYEVEAGDCYWTEWPKEEAVA